MKVTEKTEFWQKEIDDEGNVYTTYFTSKGNFTFPHDDACELEFKSWVLDELLDDYQSYAEEEVCSDPDYFAKIPGYYDDEVKLMRELVPQLSDEEFVGILEYFDNAGSFAEWQAKQ